MNATGDRDPKFLVGLVRELCKLPKETPWAEFSKHSTNPSLSAVERNR